MGHAVMHNVRRAAQFDVLPSSLLPSSIGSNFFSGGAATQTGLIVETRKPLTTVYETLTFEHSTKTNTVFVTDSASLSALRASESSSSREHATTTSAVPAATSSKAAAKSSDNNLSTLIPAIVVPVAVILVASFAVFWFMMRRRHKRQLKAEPQFVMAHKTEKPSTKRGERDSHSSGHSSTRELVPMSKLEKETAVTTTEVKRTSMDLFPPKYTHPEIGVARPMTPPDKKDGQDQSGDKPFRNFSSVRPTGRNRSGTGASSQSAAAPRSALSPKATTNHSPPKSARPSSPRTQGPPQRPMRPEENISGSDILGQPRQGLGKIATQMDRSKRAPPPSALNPPTPTGAFNGASPISQFSPIVKGRPDINSAARPDMPPLKNISATNRGTDSPIEDNVLSHENMRIARLANSSRLGFANSPVTSNFPNATNRSLGPVSKAKSAEPNATSPQLPPPLTKGDLPPRIFTTGPHSPAGGSSIYPSPSIGLGATPQLGTGFSTTSLPQSEHTGGVASNHARHISAISRLSSDDGYVDMELDAKSDVSSLDDREKWEMDQDRLDAESQLGSAHPANGYGSAFNSPIDGPAASSASTGVAKPNLRDRDSEGPFVLSRY